MTPAAGVAGGGRAAELLRRVRRLELAARKNVAGLLKGDWPTAIPGRGLLFKEPRKYVPGEPARHIDWNVTARLNEPYVKVHLEERQREVWIALDVSPSMHSGWQARTKLETGVELAATLALAAVEGGDRVGYVVFADEVLASARPRGGRRQLFRVLQALLGHVGPWRRPVAESDPRAAFHEIQRFPGNRLVVFLISDFIDHDVPDDLKFVRARHDVSLLHVYDPLEVATAAPLVLDAVSPEGAPRRSPVTPAASGGLEEMRGFLDRLAARRGMTAASFSTAEPVDAALSRFFHLKRRRAVR